MTEIWIRQLLLVDNPDFVFEKTKLNITFIMFLANFWDSRHFQLATYTVFDEESNFQVKNEEIRRPEAKK